MLTLVHKNTSARSEYTAGMLRGRARWSYLVPHGVVVDPPPLAVPSPLQALPVAAPGFHQPAHYVAIARPASGTARCKIGVVVTYRLPPPKPVAQLSGSAPRNRRGRPVNSPPVPASAISSGSDERALASFVANPPPRPYQCFSVAYCPQDTSRIP